MCFRRRAELLRSPRCAVRPGRHATEPGILARTHPLTPQRNVDLTRRFAQYHARALDGVRSLYFTEERFDDFYMGKGSTYPDLHSGVGILFEQGSARAAMSRRLKTVC